ncbi:hypothetical protein [Polyangium spumosum]|uniref:Uncharacterized protein n=1 Tax=Polyangium spumosum TaxID=889282 RepID=A0A6N7PHV1_9BACT|nr:hypothetical protein [Polyangium spumosum]MRG91663.1 hypothetical protein [Polyangium spumosum]
MLHSFVARLAQAFFFKPLGYRRINAYDAIDETGGAAECIYLARLKRTAAFVRAAKNRVRTRIRIAVKLTADVESDENPVRQKFAGIFVVVTSREHTSPNTLFVVQVKRARPSASKVADATVLRSIDLR